MPGIVGLATRLPRARAESELLRMLEAVRHEPFATTETWSDESLGLYVGWCSGPAAPGASRTENRDVVLILSGEDFSEPATPGRNAEDPSFPAGLNGRFHGLLIDRARRTATLFNDRYGLHRLYYHQSADAFLFAAQARAILALRPELRSIERRGLGEWFACGGVLENRTLFAGIDVLPAASQWTLRDGAVERRETYFQPQDWETQSMLDAETYYRELRAVFARTVPRYFGGNRPIGMSLTGGLDTRMIMATLKPAADTLPCYTFGGILRDSRDVRVARQVAAACHQPHQVIRVENEFLARFPGYAERTVYLTDGCADVSRAPDLYVNEAARQIAPVRMTGNYGSEVLRRVSFKPVPLFSGLFCPDFLSSVRRAEETYLTLPTSHPLSFAVFHQIPRHHYGLLALEETQVTTRSPYLDNELVRLAFRAPRSACSEATSWRLIGDAAPALRAIPSDRGGGGQGMRGMAARMLGEIGFKAEYAFDRGMPQWAIPINRLLAPLQPERRFLGRHKFTHFRGWYRGALSGYVRDVLLDPVTLSRPFLNPKQVEAVVHDHLDGRRNYTAEIHKLLTIELLHRLFAA